MKTFMEQLLNDLDKVVTYYTPSKFWTSMDNSTKTMNGGIEYYFTEEEDKYILFIPIIGLEKDDIDVSCKRIDYKKNIIIETKKENKFTSKDKYIFRLNDDADIENVSAVYKNGLLTISINKKIDEKKTVNISIE